MRRAQVEAARALILERFRWVEGHADVAGLFVFADVIASLGPGLAALFADEEPTLVASPEARGFVLGALVARELRAGLVLVRKAGSHHPGAKIQRRTRADWRGRELDLWLHADAITQEDRVLLVDDWVETGAQAECIRELVSEAGGKFVGVAALVDDTGSADLRKSLGLRTLVTADEISQR